MGAQIINWIKWHFRSFQSQLTWPWVLEATLVALFVGFYLSAFLPLKATLKSTHDEIARLQAKTVNASNHAIAIPSLDSFEGAQDYFKSFPAFSTLPNVIEIIEQLATKNNLVLDKGDYEWTEGNSESVIQYRMTLPLTGSYPDVRNFMHAVLLENSNISLDSVKIERDKISENNVKVILQLTIYLGMNS